MSEARPTTVDDSPGEVFLAVEGIRKSFPYGRGRLEVLKGVSLTLGRGAFASVMGVSGSGKSTLLHVLGAMEAPDEGRVLLGGRDVFAASPEARADFRNRHVGFVFQFHHLLPEFDAEENLCMPLLIRGERKAAARERALGILEELGLADRRRSRPGKLSGGEQQRLAIGRALITGPDLLLMDEPTGNLDPKTGDRVMEYVFGMTRTRLTTVLLVTHNPDLASRCGTRLVLSAGELKNPSPDSIFC
ncbi:MAG: ABC transporter ATP-binding protein [Acidobacteria bacterium]|nr:ABC transporter ATP-binding protein [Acidobacteriota bacterium]